MKKIFNSKIFFFFLGVLSCLASTVFAYSYIASDIGYTSTDSNWSADNTKDAIDWLYWANDNELLHSFSTYMRASSSSSTQAAEATFDFNKASILNNYKYFKIYDKIPNSYEVLCAVYAWSHTQQKLIALNLNQRYEIGSTTDGMRLISLVVYSQSRLNNNQATCNVGFSLYN